MTPEIQTTGFGCVRFLGNEEVYTSSYSEAGGNRDIYVYCDTMGVRRDPPDRWD